MADHLSHITDLRLEKTIMRQDFTLTSPASNDPVFVEQHSMANAKRSSVQIQIDSPISRPGDRDFTGGLLGGLNSS
uniref:Uncharacterized protein n=1 Tax=Salix viminalis TaxID=40686 RepID=A0A6N2NC42_SALVM